MLKVNQLIGFGASASRTPSFRGYYENLTQQISYSFTNCDIGVPAPNRVVAVCVACVESARATTFDTFTINGVTATLATGGGSTQRITWIYYAVVPNGSIGVTITAGWNSGTGPDGLMIGVYALYPASSTPVDALTNSANGGTRTLTDLAKTAGGSAVFVTRTRNDNVTCTVTMPGETVVSDRDNSPVTAFNISYSFQSILKVASTSTLDDATATFSGGTTENSFSGATWA